MIASPSEKQEAVKAADAIMMIYGMPTYSQLRETLRLVFAATQFNRIAMGKEMTEAEKRGQAEFKRMLEDATP